MQSSKDLNVRKVFVNKRYVLHRSSRNFREETFLRNNPQVKVPLHERHLYMIAI